MELLEGSADYTSWFYLHNLGLIPDADIHSYMNAFNDEPYYRIGALQLYILQHWLGEEFNDVGNIRYNAFSIE